MFSCVRSAGLLHLLSTTLILCWCSAIPASSEAPTPTPDPESVTQHAVDSSGKILEVPYVATPAKVVDKLIEMAALRDGDVVYDLGCGDGRIIFAALKHDGVRGVGYDLDPQRIKECEAAAAEAGVTTKATFRQKDIFAADLSPATVVAFYLVPDVNNRLLPKLLRELRPGTRILSHNYGFDAWPPAREESMEVSDIGKDYSGNHSVKLWIVPDDARDLLAAAEAAARPPKAADESTGAAPQ